MKQFFTSLRVGLFLAFRDIRRASKWTTGLIILVMVLTFLNLVVVSGILVGLIDGSIEAVRTHFSGDVLISNLPKKDYIEKSSSILALAEGIPDVEAISARYAEGAQVQANYKTRTRFTERVESAGLQAVGIDPKKEDEVTNLSKFLIEGSYLEKDDYGKVLIGANLLHKYSPVEFPGFESLRNVGIGSRVRLVVNGTTMKEMTIKGILKGKVDQIDFRIFMVDSELRSLLQRSDYNVDEIAIKLKPGADPTAVKAILINGGSGQTARIQTWPEAQPKFLQDISLTMSLLGNVIGSIGLVVASITIFIVIFVNAITRRRSIGILKGIGVNSLAIEFSYVTQALFYAVSGITIGFLVVFGLLKPYFVAHPIDFPFSDGILVATVGGTLTRGLILLIATIIAGYIPAKLIVKQNTLDAILGR